MAVAEHARRSRGGARRLGVGLLAALASGAAMLLARLLVSARTPVDMVFDLTGHLLGVPAVFNVIHALPFGLDHDAKYALFAAMGVLYLALWTLAAPLFVRLARPWRLLLPAVLTAALVGLALLPLEGLGAFGLRPGNYFYPPLATHLWAALFGLVYGAVLLVARAPNGSSGASSDVPRSRHDPGRRDALGHTARGLLVLAVGAGALRLVLSTVVRAADVGSLVARIKGMPSDITSVKDHYVVSKNFSDPKVPASRWALKVHGLVDHQLDLTLDDLRKLPSVSRPTTLICISNEVGGHLVGNSTWTGVPMKDLLDMVGVKGGATHLVLRAADNYLESLPLAWGRKEGTMVAYLQDGEPLTTAHGFPARLLVPGKYGMKSVKWLVDVELVDHEVTGYWEQRGWSQEATVQTMSRIDTSRATPLDGAAAIGGIAFAGLRGIQAVQVSLDGGSTWQPASLRPADDPYAWTLWGLEWDAKPGEYEVLVRAVDGEGKLQTSARSQPLPDGATGYHQVRVKVG